MYDALAVHRELGAPDDAVLIGHDWGAFTASAIAAYPDSPFAEHISMAVPPVGAINQTRGSIGRQLRMMPRQLRNSWYILFFQLPGLPERVLPRVIPRLWRDWGPAGYDTGAELDDALAALPSPAHRRAAVGYYRAMVRPSRPAPRYADLHKWCFEVPQGAHPAPAGAAGRRDAGRVCRRGRRRAATGQPGGDDPVGRAFPADRAPEVIAEAVLDYLGDRQGPR